MHTYDIKITFGIQNSHYSGKIDSEDANVTDAVLARLNKHSEFLFHGIILDYKITDTYIERQNLYSKGYIYMANIAVSVLYQSRITARNMTSALHKAIDEFYSEAYYAFSGEKRNSSWIEYIKAKLVCCIADTGISMPVNDITDRVKARVKRNMRRAKNKSC